jgi:circadian clock protein KaiB
METFELELYVVGQSARSLAAIANLEKICRSHLEGNYQLRIVDVLENPEAAEAANVLATPTLIRRAPRPVRRLIGDLSPTDIVLRGLGIEDVSPVPPEGSH